MIKTKTRIKTKKKNKNDYELLRAFMSLSHITTASS
jgi:hypothetical protein